MKKGIPRAKIKEKQKKGAAMKNITCTITAHSGCMGTPDNSLESIDCGVQYGAQIVEIDLRFAKDGTPILTHDAPKGGEVTLDEAFAKVSTFECLLVNVDVKECTGQLSQVSELAKKHGIEDRIFFTGLFKNDIPTVKKACPDVPYWLNVGVKPRFLHTKKYLQGLVELVRSTGALGINMNKKNAGKMLVDVFHKNGLQVSLWTVNEVKDMKRCIALSPENITTRQPEKLMKLIK